MNTQRISAHSDIRQYHLAFLRRRRPPQSTPPTQSIIISPQYGQCVKYGLLAAIANHVPSTAPLSCWQIAASRGATTAASTSLFAFLPARDRTTRTLNNPPGRQSARSRVANFTVCPRSRSRANRHRLRRNLPVQRAGRLIRQNSSAVQRAATDTLLLSARSFREGG